MIATLNSLVNALRHELQEYGEMLARLEAQQECIVRHAADDLLASVGSIQAQTGVLHEARESRRQMQERLAVCLEMPAETDLSDLGRAVPSDYQPLVRALCEENRQLLARVQQCARQNHLLLRHSLDLMCHIMESLLPAGNGPIYDQEGRTAALEVAPCAVYEAIG